MNTEVIVALIGLFGIGLGAFLAGVSYLYKVNAERKKNAKMVLYYLLEIWYKLRINFYDAEEVASQYWTYYNRRLENKGIHRIDFRPEVKSLLVTIFGKQLALLQKNIDKEVVLSYEKALIELSKDYPILAYSLRGKEELQEFVSIQKKSLNDAEDFFNMSIQEELIKETIMDQLSISKNGTFSQLLDDLKYDIKIVSWKCGFTTFIRSLWLLRNSTMNNNIDFNKLGLDETIDQLITTLQDAIKHESQKVDSTEPEEV